jgi:hypothetical protein
MIDEYFRYTDRNFVNAMFQFEKFLHPRSLVLVIPVAFLSFVLINQAKKSYIDMMKISNDQKSFKPKARANDTVDAWFNKKYVELCIYESKIKVHLLERIDGKHQLPGMKTTGLRSQRSHS